ncbi:hypothetical protein POTOM_040582 [Populus tomentosa]|uniref:Retrotransposon gag domain-containing protein n=1 Tax=Populus tomentosa TaxID=118781 RepID=A0A8X7YQA2_POPTO|nr:hypothetical protein POTOM_040582 [Populus tomentosa]
MKEQASMCDSNTIKSLRDSACSSSSSSKQARRFSGSVDSSAYKIAKNDKYKQAEESLRTVMFLSFWDGTLGGIRLHILPALQRHVFLVDSALRHSREGIMGHLDSSSPAPTDPQELSIWTTKDAKIVSWILGSVEPHMINNLRLFGTGKEIWNYFRRIYSQNNSAKKFQVKMGIANYKQGNLSIEQFYAGFLNL